MAREWLPSGTWRPEREGGSVWIWRCPPKMALDPATGKLRAEFEIRNQSGETWRAADGFFVGVHLFDADTGTLIVDGARVAAERDLAPGESARIGMDLALPTENGRFQALISPLREHVCWFYEKGWPFLLVEAVVRDGVTRLTHVGVSTRAALSRAQAVRAVGRAFVYPFLTLWRNRGLIRVMVRRDVLGRYRGRRSAARKPSAPWAAPSF